MLLSDCYIYIHLLVCIEDTCKEVSSDVRLKVWIVEDHVR